MNQKEKIQFFRKKLLDYLKKSGREHLPWRKKGITAYEVWVSEIMLQQTQVSRVIGYYARFLERFPDIQSLAKTSWEEFLPYYAGLGYYSRGRNMLKTAQMVLESYSGKFPTSIEELVQLPGIGPYTARAIASFASGFPHLAWDTNLKRVCGRVFRGGKHLLLEADEALLEQELGKDAKKLNAAIMDFGSALCSARPKCSACMLQHICRYYREDGKREERKKRPSKKFPTESAKAIVFLHENHRQYFSAAKKQFRPFVLPVGYADRDGIKTYFREKFHLDVAVRPPHKKTFIKKQPVFLVNAQILLGRPNLAIFPKSDVVQYNKRAFGSL